MKMNLAILLFNCVALAASCGVVGAAAIDPVDPNVLVTSLNGVAIGNPGGFGLAINAVSKGRVCGKIGGVVVGQSPGGCANVNVGIPPNLAIAVIDPAGNRVNADSGIVSVLLGLKTYFVDANSTAITLPTFAQAEFVDPLTVSNPGGGPFDIDLVRSFTSDGPNKPGLSFVAQGQLGDLAEGILHAEMSSNLTGFLFSLDLVSELNQPLSINLTLGSYVVGLPAWNQSLLISQLSTLLDASNPDNTFVLSDFSFPAIPVHVPDGQTLIVTTDDVRTATASPVPEPRTSGPIIVGLLVLMVFPGGSRYTGRLFWPARYGDGP
jgi:hypothetical protein